jgi:tetratricopeptide (TPR) repeat protein
MWASWIRSSALAALFAVLACAPALADQPIDQAKKLLEAKRPKEAYDLLRPLEAKRAGEIEYDYLLGIAALDAGDAQAAIFALERVLAVNPNYLQARAEIARAYYVLGERENARREFRTVRAQNPPDAARQTIDRYLSALEPQTSRLRAFVEIGLGYDSNVNSATSRSTIAIPAFGGAIGQLSPSAQAQSSWFGAASAGASIDQAVANEWSLLAAASYTGKFNRDYNEFNTGALDGSAGARWTRGANQLVGLVQGQMYWLDNDRYRNLYGGTAQWLHNLSPTQQLTVFGQFSALRYPQPSQSPQDANRAVGGVAYSQAFAGAYSPVGFVSGYGGDERATDSQFKYLGYTPFGARLGGQATLTPQTILFGSAAYERRNYNGENPTFIVTREDNQYDLRLGLAYAFLPKWTLTPQVAYTKNNSNIELNEYDRTVATVTVRRDF